MMNISFPPNSFRYKLIHSFLSVFLGIDNYLLVKDVCYSCFCFEYDKNLVCFVEKLSRLYSLIFYTDISNGFAKEIKDYNYVFEQNIDNDLAMEIYYSSDIYYTLSRMLISDLSNELKAFYYFLIIKKLQSQHGYYVRLPADLSLNLKEEITHKELENVRYYIEGQLAKMIVKERADDFNINKLRLVYKNELVAFRESINKILVFGSLVRGEYTKDSDIDLIVYVSAISKKEIVSIKNKIKSINIINFNRKSDVHIVQDTDICRISYEGESYEVY